MPGHHHSHGFTTEPETFDGRPVSIHVIVEAVTASLDGCRPCQDKAVVTLSQNAVDTARLVQMACVGIQQTMGGLPRSLTDPDAPGLAAQPFRTLARAGTDREPETTERPMAALSAAMSTEERAEAVMTALELLTGTLTLADTEETP